MNKSELLHSITSNVQKKHPWKISQDKYLAFFGELLKICHLVLSEVKIEIKLTLDQCIAWEIARWEDAAIHNILPNDIKKILKENAQ